jgi:hypothetical protein
MLKLSVSVAAAAIALVASQASAQLGSGIPADSVLQMQRTEERQGGASGIFDVAAPSAATVIKPAGRVPRDRFGVVGAEPLTMSDLDALVFPGTTDSEKTVMVEGLFFFSNELDFAGTPGFTGLHGIGPMNNQPYCQGCHHSTGGAADPGLLGPTCPNGSFCFAPIARGARSQPTNFEFTSLDPATGGGHAPNEVDADIPANDPGTTVQGTAAFTTFGDFTLSLTDIATGAIGFFDPLDGGAHALLGGSTVTSQKFGGQVQHTRPAQIGPAGAETGIGTELCVPGPIPPVQCDANLTGANIVAGNCVPNQNFSNPNQFRRSVGERAAPPYLGRGLIEAVPTADILANTDPTAENGSSSLGSFATILGCSGAGCISGKANIIPATGGFVSGTPGRFGLRSNGVELLQFVTGGLQGELSFTSKLNGTEAPFPMLFPGGTSAITESATCLSAASTSPEVLLSTAFSLRALLRNIAPPEFGDKLVHLLNRNDPSKRLPGKNLEAQIQRGAQLFGIDLVAFANRTVGGGMTATGDGRDMNAINQTDRQLNCVGCHIPIQRTGQSPAATAVAGDTTEVGAENLSNIWAPIFSDMLIHKMPVIDAERLLQTKAGLPPLPRDPLLISRVATNGSLFNTFDLPRNLADDTFSNQKGAADGAEFRTAPLMGLGRIGPPLLHDGRVYLNLLSVGTNPAGTVTTNSQQTNAPLVVRTLDDALLAAIELHDLPAPDDANTPQTQGAGCPVPPGATNIDYGASPKDVICPALNSDRRSDARQVIYRFRRLSPDDQQAVIEFLKQL